VTWLVVSLPSGEKEPHSMPPTAYRLKLSEGIYDRYWICS
jgi:hypothetical protein